MLVPHDWREVMRSCTPKTPYRIIEMDHKSFIDWKTSTKYTDAFRAPRLWTHGARYFYNKRDLRKLNVRATWTPAGERVVLEEFLADESFPEEDQPFVEKKAYPRWNIPISDKKKRALYRWILHGVIPINYLELIKNIRSELKTPVENGLIAKIREKYEKFEDDNDPDEDEGHDEESDEYDDEPDEG